MTSAGRDAFDTVLMDIQMREMDGYEAVWRILELAPGRPIVADDLVMAIIGHVATAPSSSAHRCDFGKVAGYRAKVIASALQTDADMPAKLRHAAAMGDLAEVAFFAHGINNTVWSRDWRTHSKKCSITFLGENPLTRNVFRRSLEPKKRSW